MAKGKAQTVNSESLAMLEKAVANRDWFGVVQQLESEKSGITYTEMVGALERLADEQAKAQNWGSACFCYQFAMWPIRYPPKIKIPEDKQQQVMMSSYQVYAKLPEALAKAGKKDPGFWDGVGDVALRFATERRFKPAEEFLNWAFTAPNLKRKPYTAKFETAADQLELPAQKEVVVWLIHKAREEFDNTLTGRRTEKDEKEHSRLTEKYDLTEKIDEIVKEFQEYALSRRFDSVQWAMKTRCGTIGGRLEQYLSRLSADAKVRGEESWALELEAIGQDCLRKPAESLRLRKEALAARMARVVEQAEQWKASPAEEASGDPANWEQGLDQLRRLAFGERFEEARVLLRRLKKLPQPKPRSKDAVYVDPRVVGARFHEEISEHLKSAGNSRLAGWFEENALALQKNADRDPKNPEPDIDDVMPVLEKLRMAGRIKQLVSQANGDKYGEIAGEISESYERLADACRAQQDFPTARALYRIAAAITPDNKVLFHLESEKSEPLAEAEIERKLPEPVPFDPLPADVGWWRGLDRIEHLLLRWQFQEAEDVLRDLSRKLKNSDDALSVWARDFEHAAKRLEEIPNQADPEDDDARELESQVREATLDWLREHSSSRLR
jgi:hypothetical protein